MLDFCKAHCTCPSCCLLCGNFLRADTLFGVDPNQPYQHEWHEFLLGLRYLAHLVLHVFGSLLPVTGDRWQIMLVEALVTKK